MKISEIVKQYMEPSRWIDQEDRDKSRAYTGCFRACIRHKLNYYWDNDCVIAYIKDIFGALVLFKGSRQYFCFSIRNSEIEYGGLYFRGQRIGKWQKERPLKLFEKYKGDKKHCKIIIPESYNQYKKMMLVESIQGDN